MQAFQNRRLVSGTSERPEDQFQPAIPARAILDPAASTFDFSRALPSKGPLPNGTYQIVLTIWDKYGNQAPQSSVNVTVNNPAPAKVSATPHVYDWEDQVQVDPATNMPYTEGLIPGEHIGITFGALTTSIYELILQRREFSRLDGGEVDDNPIVIAQLPRGVGTRTALPRFNDETIRSGVQYEYRAVSVHNNGAIQNGDWAP